METTPQPPVKKYKTFQYHTSVQWESDRQGILRSDGKPEIAVSSPPEFKGLPGYWSPEDLLVSAAEICTMTTFLSFGMRKGIPLKSYRSTATGSLEFVDGKYRFTAITITPEVVIGGGWTKEQIEELFHQAHDNCLIANSLTANVTIQPVIVLDER